MKIGLALSGGAARGIAHIGVIKYLEERKVKPECIAATSAGSIVASLYCSGKSVEELAKIVAEMSWRDLVKFSWPRRGIIDSSALLKVMKKHLGELSFADLELRLLVNAVDLLSGQEIVMNDGSLSDAVVASCAIPGIFTPVKRGKYLLVDGGLLNNLPASLLKDQDVDHIISVNVGAQSLLQKEPDSLVEVLIESFDIIRRQRDEPAYKCTDTLIEPDLGDFAFHDTEKADALIEKGYEAAREALENINLAKKQGLVSRWLTKRKK